MTTAIDSHDGEHESPRYRAVAELAEFWERVCDVDTFLTVSFNEETYGRHGFSRPDVLLGFVERTLEEVGYAGVLCDRCPRQPGDVAISTRIF